MPVRRIIPSPPPGWQSWEELVALALEEADKAERIGEVPVGALVLSGEGKVIGRGHNSPIKSCDPSAHAEISALREAAAATGNYRLYNCHMVVTLEPCFMCVGALVHARIAGVVYGARDAKAGAVESRVQGFDEPMHNHEVWHLGGILEEECKDKISNFFASLREK